LLPLLTSAIFGYASLAETAGGRSKGIARYSAGQAVRQSAQLESLLAEAENRKAFLPFGVGLTACCATGCVILRAFNRGFFTEAADPAATFADDALFLGFTCLALWGAIRTSDEYLRMQTTLQVIPPEQLFDDEDSDVGTRLTELPVYTEEPSFQDRAFAGFVTLSLCILPVPFVGPMRKMDLDTFTVGLRFDTELQSVIEAASVIISAAAAASSALAFLFAEKEFADTEQRIALQCKQACLSELFSAQAQAEAARLPLRTAVVGVLLASATLAVEFSFAVAALFPWPAFAAALPSIFGSSLLRSQANAAWQEWRKRVKGTDAVESTTLELQRIASDVLRLDKFADEIRNDLLELDIGEIREFPGLPSESRRKVHFVAAELGMPSRSLGDADARVVVVKNERGVTWNDYQINVLNDVIISFRNEVRDFIKMGVPVVAQPLLLPAGAITVGSVVAPVLGGKAVTNLMIPLLVGGVSLLTIWQERSGKVAVAIAKRETADITMRMAEADARIGRATTILAGVPMYVAVGACATIASVVPFIVHGGLPPALRLLGAPLAVVAALACMSAVERQRRAQRQIEAAMQAVEGEIPSSGVVTIRNWWVAPLFLGLLMPAHLPQRLTLMCATLAIEIVLVQFASARQLAIAEVFFMRCMRVHARADAWAQEASTASRALPFGSAAALVNILLATALADFVGPLAALFPIIGLGVCGRAIQWTVEAQAEAKNVESECRSLQTVETGLSPPWVRAEEGARRSDPKSALSWVSFGQAPPGKWSSSGVIPADIYERSLRRRKIFRRAFTQGWSGLRWATARVWVRFLGILKERKPEDEYEPSPEQTAVKSIQGNLDELRVSVRSSERNWKSTGFIVTLCAVSSIASPFIFNEPLTEIILPLAGSGLTLFAVAAESKARRRVAASKVRCAQLGEFTGSLGELAAACLMGKADILCVTGISAMIGVVALLLEKPWPVTFAREQVLLAQKVVQMLLMVFQGFMASWSVGRLFNMQRWAQAVLDTVNVPVQQATLSLQVPREVIRAIPPVRLPRAWKALSFAAAAPSLFFAVWPLWRPFYRRVVASTAAGALVIALTLMYAERAASRSDRALANRQRAYALADAFSNEAEGTAAFLPFASAASVALSAGIALVTELNPVTASALTTLQAVVWIVASRKSLATKFASIAALQVDSVTSRQAAWSRPMVRWKRKFKRLIIN